MDAHKVSPLYGNTVLRQPLRYIRNAGANDRAPFLIRLDFIPRQAVQGVLDTGTDTPIGLTFFSNLEEPKMAVEVEAWR